MKSLIIHRVKKKDESLEHILKQNDQHTFVFIVSSDADVHVSVRLAGRGARADIVGLIMGSGNHRIAIHTEQIHVAPETTSNLLVKAVLTDEARFSYDGVIRVARAAQKSDAYQKNENLLLSPHAHARSAPALEILANDVRCTHGSTTGKLDEDQLWYLMSRALPRPRASQLLVEGFFEHAIGTISDTMQQEKIRRVLWAAS